MMAGRMKARKLGGGYDVGSLAKHKDPPGNTC